MSNNVLFPIKKIVFYHCSLCPVNCIPKAWCAHIVFRTWLTLTAPVLMKIDGRHNGLFKSDHRRRVTGLSVPSFVIVSDHLRHRETEILYQPILITGLRVFTLETSMVWIHIFVLPSIQKIANMHYNHNCWTDGEIWGSFICVSRSSGGAPSLYSVLYTPVDHISALAS